MNLHATRTKFKLAAISRWARNLFIGTGMLYELSQSGAFMNIGAAQGSFASGFFQRMNFAANSSEDRVATFPDPDFTALRDQFVRKIQPLEYQNVVVKKTPEALEKLNAWYKQKQIEWKGLSEDITGRIQVMIHRNANSQRICFGDFPESKLAANRRKGIGV